MGLAVIFLLCSFAGSTTQHEVILHADQPFLRVQLNDPASLECCFKNERVDLVWVRRNASDKIHYLGKSDAPSYKKATGENCTWFNIPSVQLEDTGLYQCLLNTTEYSVFTPGTYMQVYTPMEKLINIRESTKNIILAVEGILLFLCVLLPSGMLMFKSKTLHQLEMKKVKREEENIYQGLNLDDCCSTYDQIERSQAQGPYQDVGNIMEESREIQLETP